MVDNLCNDGVTIKTLVNGNLKTQKPNKNQKTCCIGHHADKSGLCFPVSNQAGLKNYVVGASSLPEHQSGP